jgi:hypothetical protein
VKQCPGGAAESVDVGRAVGGWFTLVGEEGGGGGGGLFFGHGGPGGEGGARAAARISILVETS